MLDIEKMYKKHKNAVRGVILPYELQYEVVDELMQETYCRALEAMDTFKGDSEPLTWLCGIAKNVARNHIRGVMRSVDLVSEAEFVGGDVESYADTLNASDPKDDPAVSILAYDYYDNALALMPSNMAECVQLRHEGYTNPEIAEAVGLSASRVSAYISESRDYFI